ncbi:MAG TPA: hypothetical protein VK094_00285 [Pseudogracilibacillus sp.]|nr:hypothetical protein [Pseudogracilibacillus sp.]
MKKKCSKCEETKNLDEFNKNKNRKDGHESQCRECRKEYKRKYRNSEHGRIKNKEYYWKNVERERERLRKRSGTESYLEYQRKYRQENKTKVREYKRKWDKENEILYKLKNHTYFAERKGLKSEWNEEHYYEVMEQFGGKCSLSREKKNLNMDHFIAIETGHGGTYKGNMIPLNERLNQTKSNKNPFEWIKEQSFDIQENFKGVVKYLAELNGLEVSEFTKFVYWCYENKRTEEEIIKQNAD